MHPLEGQKSITGKIVQTSGNPITKSWIKLLGFMHNRIITAACRALNVMKGCELDSSGSRLEN
jgi:hypothetical protein